MTVAYCLSTFILIDADYESPSPHKHWAKHILLGQEAPLACILNGEKVIARGLCISSNIPHTIDSDGNRSLVFLIDETSTLSRQLEEQHLKGRAYSVFSDKIIEEMCSIWLGKGELEDKAKRLLKLLGLTAPERRQGYDERIHSIFALVEEMESIDENTPVRLSESIYLSQSRTSHIFSEQVGISLSSFLVYAKFKKASQYVLKGENLTDAAIHAGFSSSAHLASTCRTLFGITPSTARDMRVVFL